jgi:hypothetical protein
MVLRLATEEDLPKIYDLGFENYSDKALAAYNTIIDREKVKAAVLSLVKSNTVYVAIQGMEEKEEIIGVMIGTLTQTLFSNDLIYSSMFFFMDERFRKYAEGFIKQLEIELRKNKVSKLIIGNPELNNADKMERFYKIMGYKKLETHYMRDLTC